MSDRCGQARALTVLTPVKVEDEDRLRTSLAGLPEGPASPLAGLPGTHFGRWVMMMMPGPTLLFSLTHDRGIRGYLEQVAAHLRDVADEVWGCCEGYRDSGQLAAYLKDHRVTTSLFVSAYPRAPLAEVLRGLELRERLGDFAARAQSMSPDEIQAAFRKAGLA